MKKSNRHSEIYNTAEQACLAARGRKNRKAFTVMLHGKAFYVVASNYVVAGYVAAKADGAGIMEMELKVLAKN